MRRHWPAQALQVKIERCYVSVQNACVRFLWLSPSLKMSCQTNWPKSLLEDKSVKEKEKPKRWMNLDHRFFLPVPNNINNTHNLIKKSQVWKLKLTLMEVLLCWVSFWGGGNFLNFQPWSENKRKKGKKFFLPHFFDKLTWLEPTSALCICALHCSVWSLTHQSTPPFAGRGYVWNSSHMCSM